MTVNPTLDLSTYGMDEGYQRLLDRASAVFADDERVGALLVVGSVGRGEADASSDLDLLAVAIDGDAQRSLMEDVSAWMDHITPRVYERVLHGSVVTCVTDDWLRLDVSVLEPGLVALVPTGPATVLFDDLDVDDPALPSPETITADALLVKIEDFVRAVGMVAMDETRDEFTILTWANEFLIQQLVDLLFVDAGRARRTLKRIHVDLPPEDAALLDALPRADADRASIVAAHLAVAAAFLPLARRLLEDAGGSWPEAFVAATDAHLRRRLGVGLPPST